MSEHDHPLNPTRPIAGPRYEVPAAGHINPLTPERQARDDTAAALEPRGIVDAYELLQNYASRIRNRHPYKGQLRINRSERLVIAHMQAAQLALAGELQIEPTVAERLKASPYRVFTDKPSVDAVVRQELNDKWVSHDPNGAYTPVTGVLWVRTPKHQILESGLARLTVQTAASVIAIPYEAHDGAHDRKDIGHGLGLALGTGYDRPDILPKESSIGVHRAVTEMAMTRVLQHAEHRWPPMLQNVGLNVALDGIIRATAARTHTNPRQVADEVLKGYYTGVNGLSRITDTLGGDGAYRFMTLDGTERGFDIHRLAHSLGIPAIADNYDAIIDRRPVDLYRW